MAELNKLYCSGSQANTGTGDCFVNLGKIIGGFLAPGNMVLTPTDLADLATTLRGLIDGPTGTRIYPFGPFVGVTDSTADTVMQTLGYGLNVPVRESPYDWVFQFIKGGLCQNNKLRTRNNTQQYVYLFDDNNVLVGTKGVNGSGVAGIAPINLDVFQAYPFKVNDGTNITQYRVQLQFQPKQINENIAFVYSDFSLSTLSGLQDVALVVASGPATGVVQILATAGCAQENLYDDFADDLDVAALWKAYRADTGAVIPVSTVVKNPGISGFTVTLDITDANYIALTATGKVKLTWDTPVALAAAGVSGYEAIPVTYTRGA